MATIGNITFACEDPAGLASFWAAALDYQIQDVPPEFMEAWLAEGRDPNGASAIIDPKRKGVRLFFQKKPKRPEVEGTHIPIHLDIQAVDREALVAKLVELGGTVVEVKTDGVGQFVETFTIMRDPEGNGFCVEQS